MKAHDAINDHLSAWRTVEHAADVMESIYPVVASDPDEVDRLFRRALTDEVRAALRKKDADGVPAYANVESLDETTGRVTRSYKQVALFDAEDFRVAIRSYRKRSRQNAVVADSLTKLFVQRFGGQDSLEMSL